MDSICKHPHFSHFQFDAAQASSSEVFRPGDPWPGFPAGTSSPHRWRSPWPVLWATSPWTAQDDDWQRHMD